MFYQTQTERRPTKMPFFVPGDLERWPSNSSERGSKQVFRVNLMQIRSVVPRDISYTNKKPQTNGAKKNRTFRSVLSAVKIL